MNKNASLLLLSAIGMSLSSCGISLAPVSSASGDASSKEEITSLVSSFEESITTSSSSEQTAEEESSINNPDEDYVPEGYSLYWGDEFEGDELNQDYWEYMIGNGNWGWGNNEKQYYTDHNDEVSGGTLKIHGKREVTVDENSNTFEYTSTRIRTYNKVYTTYGYVCARIKLSAVKGLWPAFWMLPETGYGDRGVTWWPTSGEIDIMENMGRQSTRTSSALHYAVDGIEGHHTYQTRTYGVESIEDFHVYAVEWTDLAMYWSVDGEVFFSLPRSAWNQGYGTGDDAPFNKDFHILLNMAIGGNFDGGVEPPSDWEASTMEVDYVRIYQQD